MREGGREGEGCRTDRSYNQRKAAYVRRKRKKRSKLSSEVVINEGNSVKLSEVCIKLGSVLSRIRMTKNN